MRRRVDEEIRPASVLAHHASRLRHYTSRIRQAMASGHRLGFTAEQVLLEVQNANRSCGDVMRESARSAGAHNAELDDILAVQANINDVIQALRDRAVFGPL